MADLLKETLNQTATEIGKYYDYAVMNALDDGKRYGYRYVYEPVYKFHINIPVRVQDECFNEWECCGNHGYHWEWKKVGVIQTGRKRIKVAKTFYDFLHDKRKQKKVAGIVSWKRYTPEVNTVDNPKDKITK